MTDTTRPTSTGGTTPTSVSGDASPVDRVKAEVERTKEAVQSAKDEVSAAIDDKRDGPATSVDDAVDKAATLRRGIEADIAALRARVPDTDEVADRARTIGLAVGGGVVALGTVIALVKKRGSRKAHEARVREQASAIARELARIDLDEMAEEVADESGGGKTKWVLLLAALAGGGFVAWQRSQQDPPSVDEVFGPPGAFTDGEVGPQGIGPVPDGPPPAPNRGPTPPAGPPPAPGAPPGA
jgi:hypothetical protein